MSTFYEDDRERGRASAARELEILEAARHPGVVEVVGVDEGPDGPVVRTAPVEGLSLAHLTPLTVEEVAGTVAAVASTVADLHELGVVHGALTAERIVVRHDGRPVLCGFSHGGRVGETPVSPPVLPPEATDPAGADGSPLHPGADVFALGALLRDLLERAPGAPGSDGLRLRPAGRAADALRTVADRATTADRQLRPSARALAAAVGHAVPDARLPRRSEPGAPVDVGPRLSEPRPSAGRPELADPLLALRRRGVRRSRAGRAGRAEPGAHRHRPARADGWRLPAIGSVLGRRRVVIGVGVVVAAGVAGSVTLGATWPSSAPRVPPEVADDGWPTVSDGPTRRTVAASSPTTAAARPGPALTAPPGRTCAPVATALSADTDGDGCAEALRWAGGVIEAPAARWAVGRPGDQVATGDWACSGARTLALLRPDTGEVFVFDGWAPAAGDLTAAARTVVEGGFALRAGDLDADGCPELLVDRSGREAVEVPTPAAGP